MKDIIHDDSCNDSSIITTTSQYVNNGQYEEERLNINTTTNDHNDNIEMNNINQPQQEYKTFLRIHKLNHGIQYKMIVGSYIASFLSICFFVFINAAQPLVLTNSLNIPDDSQGTIVGNLTFINELVILCVSHVWGMLSDRFGRRVVYVNGMLFMGLGLAIYPLASQFYQLLLFRIVFAIGASAASSMLSAVLADYVLYEDRGKASGLLGLSAGGGAVFGSLVLLKLPNIIQQQYGWSVTVSERLTFGIVGFLGLLGAICLWFTLQPKATVCRFDPLLFSEPNRSSRFIGDHINHIIQLAREGIVAARNPVLALSYASGFLARGDSAIATTFLSLWIYQYDLALNGDKVAALAKSGTITGIAQTFGLFFAPVAGLMADWIGRVRSMILIAVGGAVGYFILTFSTDPLTIPFIIGCCIIGCTETGMVVISTALVAQEAPKRCRGSVGGIFSLCGAIGILLASKVGGIYFDRWPGFPFALFGVFSVLLTIWGVIMDIYITIRTKRDKNWSYRPTDDIIDDDQIESIHKHNKNDKHIHNNDNNDNIDNSTINNIIINNNQVYQKQKRDDIDPLLG